MDGEIAALFAYPGTIANNRPVSYTNSFYFIYY